MIALDTNVIVRVVIGDDPVQAEAAIAVFRTGPLLLCKTVLLETEWVLRGRYKLGRETIGEAFRKLLGYRKIQVEDRGAVLQALAWYLGGMDFADALHLASTTGATRFATFDCELAKAAGRSTECPPVELLRPADR
ncbi:MAG TPA: type II toxin-antitoxin system VapC family toxin [Thermoanaerobaculia bacterium]|nr:type II toxin-antitoxin system VapC family toxin [Thermoanaerobaculia bacterium]